MQPLLDGYREDWDVPAEPTAAADQDRVSARGCRPARPSASSILYIEVHDPHFDPQPRNVRPDTDRFDRVNLALDGPNGALKPISSERMHQG